MANCSPLAAHWTLDPNWIFLNHGSFGACPQTVLNYQNQLRQQLERQPLKFFREYEGLLDAARSELATFVGANPADLVFVPNATTGVNTVLRSLVFAPGDELLTTDQEYNACRNALNYVAERYNLQIVVAPIPFPIDHPDQVIAAVLQQVSPRTRLVLLDHVTSQTGLIFPVANLIQVLTQQGIETLIDGAHAPGMLPLDLQTLGATYYTGNCHKWVCAPKGAGFLYVRPDRQSLIRPLTISHGANDPRLTRSRFHLEFDWTGTPDPTPYLCVPVALRLINDLLPQGWPAVMAANHDLVTVARQTLCQVLDIPSPAPESMIGSMASIPLPPGPAQSLQASLWEQFQIEVPIIPWPTNHDRLIRISAQLYNDRQQYEFLAQVLQTLLLNKNL